MRVKKESLLISFPTTTEAMKMEHYCMEHHLPGRLIPIPREITAGCGMSWKAAPDDVTILEEAMKQGVINWEHIYVLAI